MLLDPATLVYDKILSVLRARAGKAYNIIDWNSTRNPQPDVASTSDVPEWQLRPTGLQIQLGNASCSTLIVREYAVIFLTGSLQLGKSFLPGEWELIKAFYDLNYGALDSLKYNERSFVENVSIQGATSGISDPQTGRKVVGWASQWNINVYTSHPASDFAGVI